MVADPPFVGIMNENISKVYAFVQVFRITDPSSWGPSLSRFM